MLNGKLLTIILLAMFWLPEAKAGDASELTSRLASAGLENVRTAVGDDGVIYAAVENRVMRGTWRGAGFALRLMGEVFPEAGNFVTVILDDGVPRVRVQARRSDEGRWKVWVDYDVEKAMGVLGRVAETNSSRGKIDITLHPKISIDNHRLDVLCEYAVAVAPAFEMSLWRGNRITVQPVIPLIGGNLRKDNPLRYLRVGIADVSQELLRGGRTALTVAAGMFYPGFAGVHTEFSWMATEELTVRMKAGLMGEAMAGDGGYRFGKTDKLMVMAGGEWFEPRSRLQFQLAGGRFVYGDWGARMDVTRHLGDYAVGVYGVWTEGEHNAGFHFAIPMDRRYRGRKGRVRLRMPEYFGWEYEMVSYYKYAGQNMGRSCGTRADENRSARYFQAEYIRLNLQRMMDGEATDDGRQKTVAAKDRKRNKEKTNNM